LRVFRLCSMTFSESDSGVVSRWTIDKTVWVKRNTPRVSRSAFQSPRSEPLPLRR
jgi:hypothetical protein